MGMTWTESQKKVIDRRERNILVSAAAGSGKTAVLVERIIQKITQDKVDIDKLLIVTFTNAAAAEMRERIRDAIEKKLEEEPEDIHLQRQFTLVHNAQITTIDSFCLYVIRNYFYKIDLEPNFRVADEGELSLLRSDVLGKLLEAHYAAGEEAFLSFVAGYGSAKSDQAIQDMILKMYTYAQSYPWPDEWLVSCGQAYDLKEEADMEQADWMKQFLDSLVTAVSDCGSQMREALNVCEEPDGPYMYADALKEDIRRLDAIRESGSYARFGEEINAYAKAFPKLAAARKFEGSVEKKELVQNIRNAMKKEIKDMRDKFFFKEPEEIFLDMKKTAPAVKMLVALTEEFASCFAAEKKRKNLVDFSDMEHFALKILVDQTTKEPTETADEFAALFDEIMIDEYQDSNYVQETLLRAVSKERFGQNNLFMVGDVKQSIYRFRLARPELFMEKFDTYAAGMPGCERIDLQKNFRSRDEVLSGVNDIFYKIMCRDLGNVVYDENAALYPGADYPEDMDPAMFAMEVLVADESGAEEMERVELEARMIASRIHEMRKEGQTVTDKESGELRPMEYRDIVILLRSVSGMADTFVKVLLEEGIPAFTTSRTGYFSTVEIQTVLNMLRVIDNPMQDIPLAAVLYSPVGGFSGEDLAKIRAVSGEKTFYESILTYDTMPEEETDQKLRERLRGFLAKLEAFRKRVPYTPVHELITELLEETGYLSYITALPAGEQKCANVQMLIEQAIHYEDTSYKGLFHFVRYIEKLRKYDVDYGEADIINENENAVRIMSIHKSKGLEFPVVFAAGMGKTFNTQDTRSRLILHPELGIGLDCMDTVRRTKTPTLLKRTLARQTEEENLGEELRVLYVALTRAKEKLILCGCLKDVEKKFGEYRQNADTEHPVSFLARSSAHCYFDWVLPALYSYPEKYEIRVFGETDARAGHLKEAVRTLLTKEQVKRAVQTADKELLEKIEERLSFAYPFEAEKDIKTKVSVSEIKHQRMQFEPEEMETVQWYAEEETEEIVPDFIEKRDRVNRGALRGSAMHLVMQCLPFAGSPSDGNRKQMYAWIAEELEKLKKAGRLDETMYELVRIPMIVDFFASSLGKRMVQADQREELRKEKAFVLGIPAGEIWDCDSRELVLVQGIVDAFFYEDGDIILMDYKTDSVEKPEQLLQRYQAQLDLYARALEEATGKKIREKIIYSFHLKKEIILP
ncbi:helicase-exonuclease AddAB subunit AddA [Roseburia sp. BX0805]|uniref:ATP-dependent helicase/nuclease subunit A n=1 Tax=Roseburia yibonii TaxID=2763063 RepID=A0ABR7I6E9_9FIRM|nr:helicase-exonuclease AddAB subunit AddA [Roseburia yibonii]MBC5752502.1 helicase-exonuclease AddAB subunit AddA [Roseburia yibonii]